jgi:ABC transport system ATP-binding/permease protein
MAVLISCQSLTKSFGARPLFQGISLGIDDGERLGMIGPNGSGKSTLLKILAGLEKPDDGIVSAKRNLRLGLIGQQDELDPERTVTEVLNDALADTHLDEMEQYVAVEIMLGQVGFPDPQQKAGQLSGGWRKRLAIAQVLIHDPELLLMDEPTNHLDMEGVLWLEDLLKNASFSFVLISHDRYFLENVTNRIVELNSSHVGGYFNVTGNYKEYLERRAEYLAAQAHREAALAGQVKKEIEWLRRGPPARTTKAQARIDGAERLIAEHAETKYRNNQNQAAAIDFTASGRRTKDLLIAKDLTKSFGGKLLFRDLDVILSPGSRLGLLGPNGSGKSSLIRVLTGEIEPDAGSIKHADKLRTVYFDQNRKDLDGKLSLKDALSPNSDNVVYQGSPMHVSGWAKRFLFRMDQLNQPVARLSGGERARVLIARLMLQPADLLILDEPTNDLDIPTLEVLEDSLNTFAGAVLLVTHDRFLLDRVSTEVLAIDGKGGSRYFAGYAQWEARKDDVFEPAIRMKAPVKPAAVANLSNDRMTRAQKRELEQVEAQIARTDETIDQLKQKMLLPEIAANHVRLQEVWQELQSAEIDAAKLYTRWETLEQLQTVG